MKKKLVSLLLAAALCVGLTAPALADDTKTITTRGGRMEISNVLYETEMLPGLDHSAWFDAPVYWVSGNAVAEINFIGAEAGDTFLLMALVMEDGAALQQPVETVQLPLQDGSYTLKIWLNDEEREYLSYADDGYIHWVAYRGDYICIGFVNERGPGLGDEKPSGWAMEQVTEALIAGIVPDALQSQYTDATTRAEFCALAVALFETVKGDAIAGRAEFVDTKDVNVEKMAALGVVNGVGGGRFDPNQPLTREQAATMLSRLAAAIGNPLPGKAPTFSDYDEVAEWARAAVGDVQAAGIMGGIGNNVFSPQADYTREQSIVTMLRLFNFLAD